MKRDQYFEKKHKSNLKTFIELAKLILSGKLRISDIRIDYPQFGNARATIFFHEAEEKNG